MASSAIILNFWFGEPESPEFGRSRSAWFVKKAAFDRQMQVFLPDYAAAAAGTLNAWQTAPRSCLALILLLDQFPRNLFRHQPQAFATDEKALALAKFAVSQGYDHQLLPVERWFIYLPFEHSESLSDQDQSVELFATLKDDPQSASAIAYAERHREVIERFGRFPHRNRILGRVSTPEELEFLQQPGSSF
ncbi:MAG: DUF924 domain-containing protein [Chloroflexaceae bacterium]|nr:DUF924 domain-containing protein [Chloroflexaceae bacterium]